ncbi:hypothetical protein PHLGIDRAFT_322529 [Phlebiopsis gigantea 11061_1 CR5-6]|uniref:Secreted protein n=1 Tax=Phlebiopsis gigantea (strain 11061_1 CR5-6) TaxID=745531 RepID=A0A0C3NVL2_PHLG1|nr:hypothetical protein PHLGIDRAFT_322529 [Phlebiopsis gigantea 11061_1 CR5-6]
MSTSVPWFVRFSYISISLLWPWGSTGRHNSRQRHYAQYCRPLMAYHPATKRDFEGYLSAGYCALTNKSACYRFVDISLLRGAWLHGLKRSQIPMSTQVDLQGVSAGFRKALIIMHHLASLRPVLHTTASATQTFTHMPGAQHSRTQFPITRGAKHA